MQCKWNYWEVFFFLFLSVQHAVKHNQALMYINEHQKCILNEEKNRVLSLQSQLLEVKCRLQQKPDETSLQQYKLEIASLNQKLEKVFIQNWKSNYGMYVTIRLICMLGWYSRNHWPFTLTKLMAQSIAGQ